jgi:hypothetical protein
MPVVNNRGETRVNTNLNDMQDDSSIAYLADGGWIVTWTSNDRTAGGGQNIYQQRYAADGARVGVEERVNVTTANAQYQSSVAALKYGGWVVVWTSVGSDGNFDVYARCYDAFGKEVTGEIPVNSPSATAQYTPSVIGLSNGGWLVTWSSNGQDSSGVKIAPGFTRRAIRPKVKKTLPRSGSTSRQPMGEIPSPYIWKVADGSSFGSRLTLLATNGACISSATMRVALRLAERSRSMA